MPDIDAVERLLCQRYNVRALGEGELTDALAAARAGDVRPLTRALAARDLYRWQEPIALALSSEADEPDGEDSGESDDEFAGMTVAELRAHAQEHSIDLGAARRKAEIVEAIKSATAEAPAETPDGSQSEPPAETPGDPPAEDQANS
jgi:hypothetical protein